jgi:hypothetical protein
MIDGPNSVFQAVSADYGVSVHVRTSWLMAAMGGLAVLSMRLRLERPPWLIWASRLGGFV